MLAKAVAHHTTASFIRVVGSEFVQKYLGEGPRMVLSVTISIKIMSSNFNP
jgi:26S proteasome regulatory subunit T3